MIKESPLVSVLITAYNREDFLPEAIESVLQSTYRNLEIIIVDDGSTDRTFQIAKHYAMQDARLRVYRNEKNLGDYKNRNRAASFATGIFIMSVDSDDRILKDGIHNCVQTMLKFPTSSFGIYLPNSTNGPLILSSVVAIRNHFFKTPFLNIGPGGTIMLRSFFEKIKKYPEKYGPANDLYFNLKAAAHSPVVFLTFEFNFYRRHKGQEINNHYSYLINNYRYLKDALNELPLKLNDSEIKWLQKKNQRRFVVNICKFFFRTFNFTKTNHALSKAEFGLVDALKGIFH